MKYSSCAGRVLDQGFTTDQKAAMFARFVTYRRGYKPNDCYVPKDPGSVNIPRDTGAITKRSAMQDLIDGKCPDFDRQVSIIQNQPTGRSSNGGSAPSVSVGNPGGGGSRTTPAASTPSGSQSSGSRSSGAQPTDTQSSTSATVAISSGFSLGWVLASALAVALMLTVT
jgi:hypothetical protein